MCVLPFPIDNSFLRPRKLHVHRSNPWLLYLECMIIFTSLSLRLCLYDLGFTLQTYSVLQASPHI